MVYTVALTGGIGSGKSTVSNIFMQFGITVIDDDVIARKVVEPGTYALNVIANHFGTGIINADGTLNRFLLRKYIFSSPNQKDWLNNLLHPLIYQEAKRQIEQATSPYVLWTVPLLIEKNLHKEVNFVLVVDVVPEIQIKRTMKRDNISRKHAKRIISSQITRKIRLSVADAIIDNNGTTDMMLSDIKSLHLKYLAYSAAIHKNFN